MAGLVAAGRARWKIENENNNVLKTKGYHLEHNFAHGQEHLSSLLATMNLLAFALHTFLELADGDYQLIRALDRFRSRRSVLPFHSSSPPQPDTHPHTANCWDSSLST